MWNRSPRQVIICGATSRMLSTPSALPCPSPSAASTPTLTLAPVPTQSPCCAACTPNSPPTCQEPASLPAPHPTLDPVQTPSHTYLSYCLHSTLSPTASSTCFRGLELVPGRLLRPRKKEGPATHRGLKWVGNYAQEVWHRVAFEAITKPQKQRGACDVQRDEDSAQRVGTGSNTTAEAQAEGGACDAQRVEDYAPAPPPPPLNILPS